MSILNVKATGIAYIPVVVNLHEVGLERAGCICIGTRASLSSLDVIGKCCTAPAAPAAASTPCIASVPTPLVETSGLCDGATPPLLIPTRLGNASSLVSTLLGYASACVRCKRWDM